VSGETKWTKGPWRAEPFTSNPQYASIVTADGDSVAEVVGDLASPETASLLAAAPDLYAALERLRAEVITNPAVVLWPESMRDALTDAVAALARARGEVTQ
jgi:hypothetical protein